MQTSPSVTQLAAKRSSWRKYQREDLDRALLERIDALLESAPPGPFGHRVRLRLLRADSTQREAARKLGTYGVIRGACYFLAGAIEDGPYALEDYGYVFEWVVLQLTALDLNTCWLGGTFRRSEFGAALQVSGAELVPAVSPVGHAASKRSAVDHAFRWAAGSKRRKPWSQLFFDGTLDTPLDPALAGRWGPVLDVVRMAPSASNKQPWRLVRDGERWHVLLARTPGYRNPLTPDLQRVDIGIALCHFELGAREQGLAGRFAISEPGLRLPGGTSYVCTWVPAA